MVWLLAAAGVVILMWRSKLARRWIIVGGAILMVGWICAVIFSPRYRTQMIVRHLVTHSNWGLKIEVELVFRRPPSAPNLAAFAELLSDQNPEVRYWAARLISAASDARYYSADTNASDNVWFQAGIRESLINAVSDSDPEIVEYAMHGLRRYHDPATANFLLTVLKKYKGDDQLCPIILETLGIIADPQTVAGISSLCEDPRPYVSHAAIEALDAIRKSVAFERIRSTSVAR